jgi:hypothetical protein
MFEKEAEERITEQYGTSGEYITRQRIWQEGAEFGYNKANEWNYVSEKGLPKESGRYFVYFGGGENGVYPLDFDTEANDFGYWCLEVASAGLGVTDTIFETITERNEDKVIAWKKIVLPELPKESE